MKIILIITALLIAFACIVGKSIRRIERPEPEPPNDDIDWLEVRP